LVVTADIPSWPIFVTLIVEAMFSIETSVLTKGILRNISEYGIHYKYIFGTLLWKLKIEVISFSRATQRRFWS
jgi:hypothetical protein